MFEMIVYWINYTLFALAAPFFYWFGKYTWFMEFTVIVSDWGELIGLFMLVFYILNKFALFNNIFFQIFNFFRPKTLLKNFIALLTFIFSFFSNILRFFFVKLKQIYNYFFKKKK